MLADLSKLSILFTNYISHDLDDTKIHLYKLFVQYLVVKHACVMRYKLVVCLIQDSLILTV